MRIGHGYDVHQLVAGRRLVLGGVTIPHTKGLLGHSDADVLIHAVCDACLGAAGLGDIGRHFPDTDAQYKDIDSRILLRRVCASLKQRRLRVENIDSTLIAQAPKLAQYLTVMVQNIATDLEIDVARA
jgi:2-C-methyl-D-erythritol 2,4-cyclodiphosphate synthase